MPLTPIADGEHVVWVSSEHWIKYLKPTIIYILLFAISVMLFFLAGYSAYHQMFLSHGLFLAAILLFLLVHHWFFWVLLGETEAHIIVTNKRVIHLHQRLFLEDEMIEIAFEKMKTVEAHKNGFLESVLRYGTLQFESGAVIHLVPHPNEVAKKIQQTMGLL